MKEKSGWGICESRARTFGHAHIEMISVLVSSTMVPVLHSLGPGFVLGWRGNRAFSCLEVPKSCPRGRLRTTPAMLRIINFHL